MVKENAVKILNLIKQNSGLEKAEVFDKPTLDIQKIIDLILSECRCSITDKDGNYTRFGSSTDIRVIRLLIQIFLSNEKEIPAEVVSMALTKEGIIGPLKKLAIEKKYNEHENSFELEIENIFPKEFYVSIFSENLEVKELFIKNVIKPYVKNIIFENDELIDKCPKGAIINKYFMKWFKKNKENDELIQELINILKTHISTDDELVENIARYIFVNIMSNKFFKDELVNRTIHTTELQKIGKIANGFGSLVDSMAYEVLQMLELRSFPYGEITAIKNTFYTLIAVLEVINLDFNDKNEEKILAEIERINRYYTHKEETKYREKEVNSNKFGLITDFVDASNVKVSLQNICMEIVELLSKKDEMETHEYIKEAERIHFRLVKTQSFEMANGRTARAIFNILMMQKGLIGIFRKNSRGEYIEYINSANRIINDSGEKYISNLSENAELCKEIEDKFLEKSLPVLLVKE